MSDHVPLAVIASQQNCQNNFYLDAIALALNHLDNCAIAIIKTTILNLDIIPEKFHTYK